MLWWRVSVKIQQSIDSIQLPCVKCIAIAGKCEGKLAMTDIAVGTNHRVYKMARSWSSSTIDVLFNSNHRGVTNQFNE